MGLVPLFGVFLARFAPLRVRMHVHTVNNMHTHAHKKGQNFEFPSVTGIIFHASFYLFFALFAEACGASTRPPLACRPQAGGRNTNREDRRAGGGSSRASGAAVLSAPAARQFVPYLYSGLRPGVLNSNWCPAMRDLRPQVNEMELTFMTTRYWNGNRWRIADWNATKSIWN